MQESECSTNYKEPAMKDNKLVRVDGLENIDSVAIDIEIKVCKLHPMMGM